MTSRYQHLNVVERIEATFGPLANIWDKRHDVWRFESTKISQLGPIIVQGTEGRELHLARWGLLPHWFRKPEAEARKFQSRTFNARSETAHEKASFKTALKKTRCLVPAVSFTEWEKTADGKREVRMGRADADGGDVGAFDQTDARAILGPRGAGKRGVQVQSRQPARRAAANNNNILDRHGFHVLSTVAPLRYRPQGYRVIRCATIQ